MKKKVSLIMIILVLTLSFCSCFGGGEKENKMIYFMPSEDLPHEGTWLTWPHKYTYGIKYQNEIENIWVQMTAALTGGENVHIVAYNETEKARIEKLLSRKGVDMAKVDFTLAKSNDVWVRDTGPMFVFDETDKLVIADFKFDGWGEKTKYDYDDNLPKIIGESKKFDVVDVAGIVLEGGSIELDGNGTLMATLSSVVSSARNSHLTVKEAEDYFKRFLGVKNFLWLEGVVGEDITDAHIDGMARFFDAETILTVSEQDFELLYENINMKDYKKLINALNADGKTYQIVELPLTSKDVSGLDYRGSYLNHYIGNDVVLLPIYNDENDSAAIEIIKKLYPDKNVTPIVVNSL